MKQVYQIVFVGFLLFLSKAAIALTVGHSSFSSSSSLSFEDNHEETLALFMASVLEKSGSSLLLTDSLVVYNNYANGDSSKWHKARYEYDHENLMASVFYYKRNNDQTDWESYQKEVFQFNAAIHQTNFTLFIKSEIDPEWTKQLHREYHYNENHQLLGVAEFHWNNTASDWEGQWKYEMAYNSSQLQQQQINYIWNGTAKVWSPVLKHEFEYTNHELIRKVSYTYNTQNFIWEGHQKSEYVHENNVLMVQTDYTWDQQESPATWLASNKKEFFYNDQGALFSWKWYKWNRNYLKWDEWWKIEQTEDESTNTFTWVDAEWNDQNKEWINSWRVEKVADASDKVSEEVAYAWNNTSGIWSGIYRLDYIYGEEEQLQSRQDYYWDASSNHWNLNQKQFYYLSATASGPATHIKQENGGGDDGFRAYPNPAQSLVFIESSSVIHSLQLYAPDGRLLEYHTPNDRKTEISVRHLPAGLYIIKTGTANETRFSKIIVKK